MSPQTVTGLFTGCTFDSSIKISFTWIKTGEIELVNMWTTWCSQENKRYAAETGAVNIVVMITKYCAILYETA